MVSLRYTNPVQILSLTGASFILVAFIATAYDRMGKESLVYGLLNFFGAAFLAVTLIQPLNVGALILEIVWSITGLLLVIRSLRNRAMVTPHE